MGAGEAIDLAGAVLVGGASRRMGRDKAAMPWGPTTMGAHAVAALRDAGCEPVIAIGGRPDLHAALGVRIEPDRFPGEGPLGGIITALHALDQVYVAIVACDMPWIDASVVSRLAEQCSKDGVDVAVAQTSRPEPLLAVWASAVLPALEEAFVRGERAVHALLESLNVMPVVVAPEVARNVNTPGDVPWST